MIEKDFLEYEIKKVTDDKKKVLIIIGLLLLYIVLFVLNFYGIGNEEYSMSSYNKAVQSYILGDLKYYQLTKEIENPSDLKLKFTKNVDKENKLLHDLLKEIDQCNNYKTDIKKITNNFGFGEENKFISKKNCVLHKTYDKFNKNDIIFSGTAGIKLLFDFNVSYLFLMLAILVFASMLFENDRKEVGELIYTYVYRDKIFLSKVKCGFLYSIIISVFVFLIKLFFVLNLFGIEILNYPIQTVPGYNYSYLNINIWQYIILYIVFLVIGNYTLFFIDFLVIALVKNDMIGTFLLMILNCVLLILYLKISLSSDMAIVKYVNPLLIVDSKELFIRQNIINVFNYPVKLIHIVLLNVFIALMFGRVAIIFLLKKNIYKKSTGINMFVRINCLKKISGSMAEFYKIFISERIILILGIWIISSILFIPLVKPDLSSETKLFYRNYIEKIQGNYTEDKMLYLRKEEKKIKKAKKQLMHDKIEPEIYEIIKKRIKNEKALKKIIKYAEYLKNRNNGSFVYSDGYLTLMGVKNKMTFNLPYMCMFLFTFIIISISVWSFDAEKGTIDIIYITYYGNKKVLKDKGIMLFLTVIIQGVIYVLMQYSNVKYGLAIKSLNAPAYSIWELKDIHNNISVNMLIFIIMLSRIIYVFIMGILSGIIYKFIRNKNIAIILTLIVAFIPILIYNII